MNNNSENPEVVNPAPPEEQIPPAESAEPAEPAAPEKPEADAEGTIDEWKAALEIAVRQRDEYLDSLRRTQADFQNFKRRNQTARADGYEDGTREVMAAVLPVIDNLERAVKAAEEAGEGGSALTEGVRMTLKSLIEAGKRFGLEELPAEGCEFNPEIHHAVMREQTDDPGKVLECFQKGYRVKDRIVRYSMVKVSVE
jgi:molecular chaperone GrpE